MSEGRNEADRLRVILETLLFAQPELKLAEALPMVWEIEKKTLALESPGESFVPGPGTSTETVARWISRPANKDIQDLIPTKKISAIKEVRAKTLIGLKEAKDAVEYWEAYSHLW